MDAKQRRVKALGYGEQRIEALGQTPYIDFVLKTGATIRLCHPLRMGDDALTRFDAFQRGDGLDREPLLDEDGSPRVDPETGKPLTRIISPPQCDGAPAPPYSVRLMKAVLGDEDYDALRQHDLTAGELYQIWQSMSDTPAASEGDDPKDS